VEGDKLVMAGCKPSMSRTIHPILIVEDDAPTQMLLETLMQRYGFATVTAPNGQAAIDLLADRDFTAIVLDLMMPHVGGSDVIDFLSREKRRIPVIVCTAAGPDKTSEFDPAIVSAVMRKPFDIETLIATIFGLASQAAPTTAKVLIVDADTKSRYMLKALLEPAPALEAADADGALAMLRQHRPDVVLLGLSRDGAAPRFAADVPVVVVAYGPLDDERRAALLQSAAGVLDRRELSRQTLAEVFDRVLGAR
jgi:CheY-like chemotaxis protein